MPVPNYVSESGPRRVTIAGGVPPCEDIAADMGGKAYCPAPAATSLQRGPGSAEMAKWSGQRRQARLAAFANWGPATSTRIQVASSSRATFTYGRNYLLRLLLPPNPVSSGTRPTASKGDPS